MKINEAIKKMMEAKSMRATDVAEKLKVSPQAVRYYINGQPVKGELRMTSVTVDTAVDIAAACGYKLVLVPDTREKFLPEGSIWVDERVTEQRGKRASRKNSEK